MKKVITILTLLFLSTQVFADSPGIAYKYDLYSQNGNFLLVSTPYSEYDQNSLGKSKIYDKEKTLIYEADRYFPRPSFISDNGQMIVSLAYWVWTGHQEEVPIIEFYSKGDSLKYYYLKDIITDFDELSYSVSHTMWYNDIFVDTDTLYIITTEEKVIKIPMATGEIAKILPYETFKNEYDLENKPKRKIKVYRDIKYPQGYIFPDLVNGRKFKDALKNDLDKIEVEEYSECDYYIQVITHIDSEGNARVLHLSASVDGMENQDWYNTVKNWIEMQKYKTNLHPFEEWTYNECFYLKQKE